MTTVRLLVAVLAVASTVLAGMAGLLAGLTVAGVAELVALRLAVADRDRPLFRTSRPAGAALARRAARVDLLTYRRCYNEVSRGRHSMWEYDHGLRRRLRRILAVRLLESAGIDLERQPGRARERLGDDLWPLLEPGRPATDDREATGVRRADLAALLDRLEAL